MVKCLLPSLIETRLMPFDVSKGRTVDFPQGPDQRIATLAAELAIIVPMPRVPSRVHRFPCAAGHRRPIKVQSSNSFRRGKLSAQILLSIPPALKIEDAMKLSIEVELVYNFVDDTR